MKKEQEKRENSPGDWGEKASGYKKKRDKQLN